MTSEQWTSQLAGETISESDVEWLSPVTRNQRFIYQGANYWQRATCLHGRNDGRQAVFPAPTPARCPLDHSGRLSAFLADR